MTTITYEQRPVNLMPLLVVILLAVGLASVGVAYSHGVIKHGADAEIVRECLNRNGHMQLWAHDDWEHRARVCEVEPGVFGVQIVKLIAGSGRKSPPISPVRLRAELPNTWRKSDTGLSGVRNETSY